MFVEQKLAGVLVHTFITSKYNMSTIKTKELKIENICSFLTIKSHLNSPVRSLTPLCCENHIHMLIIGYLPRDGRETCVGRDKL